MFRDMHIDRFLCLLDIKVKGYGSADTELRNKMRKSTHNILLIFKVEWLANVKITVVLKLQF